MEEKDSNRSSDCHENGHGNVGCTIFAIMFGIAFVIIALSISKYLDRKAIVELFKVAGEIQKDGQEVNITGF